MHIMSMIKSPLAPAADWRRRCRAYAPACNCGGAAAAQWIREHVQRFVLGNSMLIERERPARGGASAPRAETSACSLATGASHGWL